MLHRLCAAALAVLATPALPSPGQAQDAAIVLRAVCGGGFAGIHGGTEVLADGTIVHFRGTRPAKHDRRAVARDPAALARWNAALDAADFDRTFHTERGNMTCSLERHSGAATHVLSWPGTGGNARPRGALSAPIVAVFNEIYARSQ